MYDTWCYTWAFIQMTEPGYIKTAKPTEFLVNTSKRN